MTKRIDHPASARAALRLAGKHSGETATMHATVAQAHATLALVEQQRIANLIALWAMPDFPKGAFVKATKLTIEEGDATAVAIREGLGL